MQGPSKTEARDTFRPDIEGLRGVAVLMVVLFHSSLVVGIPGGFIGVDIFFVISGFLITGLLLRERERSGRISLTAFYARRVRRLLPAAVVALACTLVASFIILAPLDRASVALDAAAAALSVGNIRFAMAEGDYFASIASPSPLLHFWSLAVEEQFYFVWPALILAASRGRRPRLGAGAALIVVLAVSLAANIIVSGTAVNWAFYSLPTRAWQLSLGGLIAVAAGPLARVPLPLTTALGWIALPAIVGAAMVFDGSLAYPGAWALVPTLAAGALIVGGQDAYGPGRLLAQPPIRFLGRISYSLYLWHWPILVLPLIALEAEPPAAVRAGLVALAVGAAWLSWRYVEEPFRTGFPTLARHPRRTVLAGGSAVLAVVLASGSFAVAAEQVPGLMPEPPMSDTAVELAGLDELDPMEWPEESDELETPDESDEDPLPGGDEPPELPSSGAPSPADSGAPGAPGASASASVFAPTTAPTPTRTPAPTPAPVVRLPKDVRPALSKVRADEERLRSDGCLAFEGERVPADCVYGDPKGKVTVALVGDSHAAQWFPALEKVAQRRHLRLLTFTKVACPFLDMPVRNIALKREYWECAEYRDRTIARLWKLKPDLVIMSMSRFAIHPMRTKDASMAARAGALARVVEALPGRVVLLVDTPDARRDVPSCLSRHARDVRRCSIPAKAAFVGNLGKLEMLASRVTGAGMVNLSARVCRADPCPVVVDGMIVFRDSRHLTATYAASLAPDLELGLLPYLEPPPPAYSSPPAGAPSPVESRPAPDPEPLTPAPPRRPLRIR
jgi:peptidoglycan/LPS O-acetylase OafA/YrhL